MKLNLSLNVSLSDADTEHIAQHLEALLKFSCHGRHTFQAEWLAYALTRLLHTSVRAAIAERMQAQHGDSWAEEVGKHDIQCDVDLDTAQVSLE